MSEYAERYPCDCCKYETLTEGYGSCEICYLCEWENDDNYSWRYPDKVVGGANHDYSLREANQNFKKYYIMYRVAEPDRYFSLFKEEIKAKQEVITLLDLIEQLDSHKELSSISEYTRLKFALQMLEGIKLDNPYRINPFTGKIEEK